MAKQEIDIGVEGNDGTGDSIRESFRKVNENFNELYAVFGAGGQISFTNLGDTPNQLLPRRMLLINDAATAIDYVELASDTALGLDSDSVLISYDISGKIILRTSFRSLASDDSPTLGGPVDGFGYGIANVAVTQDAVNAWNAKHSLVGGGDITIDDLVITKGYADNRYVAGDLPVRIEDEPSDASQYILTVESYTDGNIVISDHGFDRTINGTPYVFQAEDVDPSNLVSGTTYYLRYYNKDELSVHRTRADAAVQSQASADANKISITHTIALDDVHTFTDEGYDENLEGFWLSNQAVPRKSVVRRQGDTMTGPLILHDSPGELAGLTSVPEELQAATKFYVDNTAYSSPTNLYVSTTGDDTMAGVPAGKEGTSWSYAYRTINAAAQRADEIMKASEREPGPYMQTLTRDNGAAEAEVVSASIISPLFPQARSLIEENRDFIIREVTAYLNFEYPEFEYNIETCERDLGLILDAIAFDINRSQSSTIATANSLVRIAAERYYASSSGKLAITRQLTETVDAINKAKDIVAAILINRPLNQVSISNVSQASICRITTSVGHGLESGNIISVKNITGMTELNDNFYYVKVINNTVLEIFTNEELTLPVNSAGFNAYSSGGIIGLVYQTDEKQFFDVGNDAGAIERQAVSDKFDLITNIIQNGIDSGASTVFGKAYKIVVNNGGLTAADQGNISNRDALPGKIIVGKISGAQGRIISYTTNSPSDGGQDVIEVNLVKAIDFIPGEGLEYGNFVNRNQITIMIESGQYEEDYPIRVANNVSIKGDEFRRVIIRPKDRVSQSPWAGTYIYRDRFFDGLTLTNSGSRFYNQTGEWQGYFGYHYLSNPEKPVNVGVSVTNAGKYEAAADILKENRKFIQEEVINYINNNQPDLIYDHDQFRDDLQEIVTGVTYDIVLGTNFSQNLYGLKFQRSKSIYLDSYLKELWVEGLTEAKRLCAGYVSGISATAESRSNAAFDQIINIIENGTLDTDSGAAAITYGTIASTDANDVIAKNQLQNNREFIAQEALAYIQSLAPRKFIDTDIRLRDIRKLVDALSYDIMYGGNFGSTDWVTDLFVDNELRLEITTRQETIDTLTHLESVIEDIVTATSVTPTTGNLITQDTSAGAATASQVSDLTQYLGIVITQLENNNLLNLPTIVYPSLVAGDAQLVASKSAIDGSIPDIQDGAIGVIDAVANINYNQSKCRRDVGLIVDALVEDLQKGGDEFSTEVQGEYYTSYILQYNNGGFGGQENMTRGAVEYVATIAQRLFQGAYNPALYEQDPTDADFVAPDFKYGTGETGTAAIVNNLISKIVFAFDRRYNPPLRNDRMDCFLMNDATILRNITVQGQGGFMCTLDPDGQILTKSPYIQTGSSFSASINRKRFAGGMFVDAYVGNLPAYIPTTINPDGNGDVSGKINNYELWIRSEEGQGLFIREPQLPCPFYIEGRRYQVNSISDYDQSNGWCKIYLDTNSNSGVGYDEDQFDEDTGNISRTLYLQTAGNRSMLGNDFTQINDLGYGLVTTNGAFSEMVSMFTYYCQAAYYAANGSEIRSTNGSNGYGNFGLVAEGADPNEIPDQVTYEHDMTYPGKSVTYLSGGENTNIKGTSSIFVTDLKDPPQPNSIVNIKHTPEGALSSIAEVGLPDASRAAGTYTGVTATGSVSGTGGTFDVVVNGSGAATVTINTPGKDYEANEVLTIADSALGSGGAADLTFTVDEVSSGPGTLRYRVSAVGIDTGTTVTGGVYNNIVYRLQITGTPAGENGDFFNTLQETVWPDSYVEIRNSETHQFDGIRDRASLVTRPSTAVNFDESDEITYRSISFSGSNSFGTSLDSDSIITTFEIPFDTVEIPTDPDRITSGTGGASGDTTIAIRIDDDLGNDIDATDLARLTRDIAGRQPGDAGYSGGMVFAWQGRTHQISNARADTTPVAPADLVSGRSYSILTLGTTDWNAVAGTSGQTYAPGDTIIAVVPGVGTGTAQDLGAYLLDIESSPVTDITGGGTGISTAFDTTVSEVLYAGLPAGTTAEITISISLCRATGHDFTQIGTGSFNDSNYPNVILGPPENSLAPFYVDSPTATSGQVWERRKGRVFWMSTDQFGFFRVGKFFSIDQGQGSISFSGEIGITGANELGFKKGVPVDEFSTDDTMADESDRAVPVEKAIVGYINKRLGRDKNDSGVPGRIGPGYMPLSGSVEMEGDLQMGNNNITNVATPNNGSDAANKTYVDDRILEFDSYEALRNVSENRPVAGDIMIYTGNKKILTSVPEDSSGSQVFAVGDTIQDVSSNKEAIIRDIIQTTDAIVGEDEPGTNIWIIVYELQEVSPGVLSADFNEGEVIEGVTTKSSVSATILRGPFDELGHAREASGSVINFSITRTPNVAAGSLTDPIAEINFQIENETIINADINPSASIAQSKLLMERAQVLDTSAGLFGTDDDTGQGSRGLAAFDSDHFAEEVQLTLSQAITINEGDYLYQGSSVGTVTQNRVSNTIIYVRTADNFVAGPTTLQKSIFANGVEGAKTTLTGVTVADVDASGFIDIKDRSLGFDKLEQIATDTVLGRSTAGTGDVESVTFNDVIDQGFGLQDVDFEDSEITVLTGQVLTFALNVSVADGDTLVQDQGSGVIVEGTVQGRVENETTVRVVNVVRQGTSTAATFNNASITISGGGGLGSPIAVDASANLTGAALVKQADGVYGTTAISTGSANNTIARRSSTGALQANTFVIGGSSTNTILSESGGTLTFSTPGGGTILTANGASNPTVNIPGNIDNGGTSVTQSVFQAGSDSNTDAFISTNWLYSPFIEAPGERDANGTGIGLGAGTGFTGAAADTIQLITNGTVQATVNNTSTTLAGALNVRGNVAVNTNQFTVNEANGNTLVAGTLTIGSTVTVNTNKFTINGTNGNTAIAGTLTVTGEASFDGSVNLGNAAADTVTINGSVDSNIVPTGTRNLGSATNVWSTVYGTTFSGTATTAKYADLAENYLADADYEPGTVVVLGGSEEVTVTSTKDDRRVAGVISTEPAHLMNSALDGEHVVAVALSGRVPCKVIGKVQKGDMLVTSAIPGYAIVNNDPKLGTVIGKAVGEKTDDGKGVVEVLAGKS